MSSDSGNVRTQVPRRPRKPVPRFNERGTGRGFSPSSSRESGSEEREVRSDEHLPSVHDNPFVKEFGLEFAKHEPETADTPSKASCKLDPTDNASSNGDTEQEYGVNSGFVNKLRSKFAQLESKHSNLTSLSRRSASLENLLTVERRHHEPASRGRARLGSSNRSSADDITTGIPKREPVMRSTEVKSDTRNNILRSSKPPLPRRQLSSEQFSKRQNRSSLTDIPKETPKPQQDHHWVVAPDVEKVGRDDIVIIEAPKPKVPKVKSKPSDEAPGKVRSLKEKEQDSTVNELPKPNTVSAFRSMFENVRKASDSVRSWRDSSSPTRTGSGSDSQSPKIASPSVTPRSPLSSKSDDNVFDYTTETEKSKSLTPDLATTDKEPVAVSPRKEKETVHISPRTKSPVAQKPKKIGAGSTASVISSSVKDKPTPSSKSSKPDTQKSAQPMSKIFDSKSIAKSPSERPRVKARSQQRTLSPRSSLDGQSLAKPQEEISSPVSPLEEKFIPRGKEGVAKEQNDLVSVESNIKPSARKSKNTAQSKKIFDSSSMVKENKPPPKIPKVAESVKVELVSASKEPAMGRVDTNSESRVKTTKAPDIPRKEENKEMVTEKPKPSRPEKRPQFDIKSTVNDNDSGLNQAILKLEVSEKVATAQKVEPESPEPHAFSRAKGEDVSGKAVPLDTVAMKGRSSFLNKRLNKTDSDTSYNTDYNSISTLTNGSSPSPMPRKKRGTSGDSESAVNGKEDKTDKPPPIPSSPEPVLPRSNIDDLIKKKKKSSVSAPTCVFDSSNIANKRKEPPKRKPPRKTIEQLNQNGDLDTLVPKLDLSGLGGESSDYQEGYIPTVITPCPYHFVGAEVIPTKSPYKKTRKSKVKIAFDDHATTTFEYAGEELALEAYLEEHPAEREQVEHEENLIAMETITDNPDPEPSPIKSNTVLDHSAGGLLNYKSKMGVDFSFGMVVQEPERPTQEEPREEENLASLQLRPAEDSELDSFSTEANSSDLLF